MLRNSRLVAMLATVSLCAQSTLANAAAGPAIPDPATLMLPSLNGTLTDADRADGDKYFYFHRDGTTFEQAFTDIHQCDDLSRGVKSPMGWTNAPYPYAGTLAGFGGEIIGNMMVALIFGSAEERKMRRANMRRCMHYKGYDRYALAKNIWKQFNFEEALKTIPNDERQTMLAQQAKAASGSKPSSEVLGK